MNKQTISASAPGKVILSGEHSVVYGYPALVSSIDRRIKLSIQNKSSFSVIPKKAKSFVRKGLSALNENFDDTLLENLNISINSSLPIGRGLGSSASFAVALSGGVLALLNPKVSKKRINELAYIIEKEFHGDPSGVDNTVCTYGGYIRFKKDEYNKQSFKRIKAKRILDSLLLLDTGKPMETTKQMVMYVKERYNKFPKKTKKILTNIGKITEEFFTLLLNTKKLSLDVLIKENEKLLEELGIVSESTKRLIKKIEGIGGAAKITGAGGIRTNSGMIIVYHQNVGKIFELSRKLKLNLMPVELGGKGVQIEKSD